MISEFVEYVKQAWKNKPNVSSPLNADHLNHMEDGIENNSNKIKEIVPVVNELTEKLIVIRTYTKTVTVPSGGIVVVNAYDIGIALEGYVPISVEMYNQWFMSSFLYSPSINENNARIGVGRLGTTNETSLILSIKVAYAKIKS